MPVNAKRTAYLQSLSNAVKTPVSQQLITKTLEDSLAPLIYSKQLSEYPAQKLRGLNDKYLHRLIPSYHLQARNPTAIIPRPKNKSISQGGQISVITIPKPRAIRTKPKDLPRMVFPPFIPLCSII